MKEKLTPKVVAAAAAVALAAIALIGWFGVVSPQRSKAADLDRQIAAAQTQLVVAKADVRSHRSAKSDTSARQLARAMPDQVATPAIIRQLQRAARRAQVRLDGITPQPATTLSGYQALPMDVVVAGRYSGIQRFVHLVRAQARVAGDRVHASGRLFSVDTVSLAADDSGLPKLIATIRMNTYVYSGSAAPSATEMNSASASSSLPSSASAAGGRP